LRIEVLIPALEINLPYLIYWTVLVKGLAMG